MEWEILEYFRNPVWKILREDVQNFPNIFEYFWKIFQFI